MASRTMLVILMALVCCVAYVHSSSGPLLGKVENERPADDEVRQVVASVKNSIKSKFSEGEFYDIVPISYKTQVVAGENYFVKAIMHHDQRRTSIVHLRIYRPIRGDMELTAMKTDVDESSPLVYFQ